MRDTQELDNKESVQYKELVTEPSNEVRHCLLVGVGGGWGVMVVEGKQGTSGTWTIGSPCSIRSWSLNSPLRSGTVYWEEGEGEGEGEGHPGAGQQGVRTVQGAGH